MLLVWLTWQLAVGLVVFLSEQWFRQLGQECLEHRGAVVGCELGRQGRGGTLLQALLQLSLAPDVARLAEQTLLTQTWESYVHVYYYFTKLLIF